MLTAPFINLLYAFIVCRVSTFGKCAALVSLRFLHILDRGLDFPQEHFRYIAGGRTQAGNGVEGVEVKHALKIFRSQVFVGIVTATDKEHVSHGAF
ncbi:hypothetical protein L7E55_16400 [Pelotomaculum isophthalicicum JI]|uniref:Uncharacterized protein n=1 Tax=Pelotomaculum isophthalicicum JI TaxID=947010 RepID=A0A9X4H0K4_9FIRM|nr:hypothetical protein [Pelotomaculum isophthalicicum]MDF9409907.1 hypothetical protein [Pelotomaculum isophthalicicum JI]